MSTRAPLHPTLLFVIKAGCLIIIAGCLAAMMTMISHIIPLRLAGQAYLTIVILFAFRYWPPLTRLVASMPVVHRVVFLALILGMIVGHYTLNGRTYFPYVTWQIFPNPSFVDPVTCNEFIATTMDGRKVRLIAEQLFPSIVQIDRVEDFDDPRRYPPGTTEHLARALAQAYNEHHPDNPVWRVDLMRLAVQLHPPATESRANPSCELLKSYDISSGQ